MTGFLMVIHAIVCVLLVTVILMQSGRGGGLNETVAASAESMFGAQTSAFMIRTTTIISSVFLVTCLGLAVLSTQKGKSIMPQKVAPQAPQSLDDLFEDIESIDSVTDEKAPEKPAPAVNTPAAAQ